MWFLPSETAHHPAATSLSSDIVRAVRNTFLTKQIMRSKTTMTTMMKASTTTTMTTAKITATTRTMTFTKKRKSVHILVEIFRNGYFSDSKIIQNASRTTWTKICNDLKATKKKDLLKTSENIESSSLWAGGVKPHPTNTWRASPHSMETQSARLEEF